MARVKEENREKTGIRKALKIIIMLLLLFVLLAGSYVAYVFIDYHRIEDNKQCEVSNPYEAVETVPLDKNLTLQSWNIGFAAYLQDFSFFMDGGKESRARSEDAVKESMEHIVADMKKSDADFYNMQEVDIDSTRAYHVDEAEIVKDELSTYSNTFAQNYDSPYLMYPIFKPHGASKSGLLSLSKYEMQSSLRKQLPIQTDFAKLIDLDRCYDIVRYDTEDGKELVVINLHLSAYTTDPTIADSQIEEICEQIEKEYEAGNYVICAGDFNKDMNGDSDRIFGNEETRDWAKAFKTEMLPEGFSIVSTTDRKNPVPSCRDCDEPYKKGRTYVSTIDGIIVSDNIEVVKAETLDYEFKWSDHNPLKMVFRLKGAEPQDEGKSY